MKPPSLHDIALLDPIPRRILRLLAEHPELLDDVMRPAGVHPAAPGLTAAALIARYPAGVPLAIWHDATKKAEMYTFSGYALKWALTWSALGPHLAPGRTWRDDRPLDDVVLELHASLRALTGDDGPSTKISDLALFCHGQSQSILYGTSHIGVAALGPLVQRIAPALAPAVRVVLYACSTGRDPHESPSWQGTTLHGGGPASFAARLRDALVREGKHHCSVWGHTTAGHTATNSALRFFKGDDGIGAPGRSFAADHVHDWQTHGITRARAAVTAAKFTVRPADEPLFAAAAREVYSQRFYASYAATCRKKQLLVHGQRLAMTAPMDPAACAAIIAQRWEATWKLNLVLWGKQIARKAKLHP